MRFTKQDRINQLEGWLARAQEDLKQEKARREWSNSRWKENFDRERARLIAARKALGRIVNVVDRVIGQRRSTEDERSIKAIAKVALNESEIT